MEDKLIHKVKITIEAKFDYADLFGLLEVKDDESVLPYGFNLYGIRNELEEYLQNNKKLWYKRYFKVKYIDEDTGRNLFIFIRQAEKLSIMQNWNVVGFCNYQDWDEDLEECGQIKAWLDTKIENLDPEEDWVVVSYRNKIIDLLESIKDVGGRDGYIRACEELIRRLSSKSGEIEFTKFTNKRIRKFINEQLKSSAIGDEIIRTLNELLEIEGQRAIENDIFR